MKAIILAAGFGLRLQPLTNELPKCLVGINGKPILFKQLDNLYENGITDITIIAGYKADVLKRETLLKYPDVKIIISEDYENTNNMYSAYLGIKSLGFCNLLMMNGDVFFDSSILKSLIEDKSKNAIAVDVGNYLEESMKVVVKDQRIVEIAKTILPVDAFGVSIDVYKFSADGCKVFFDKCAEYIEKRNEVKKWSEVALNDILKDVVFTPCSFSGRWYEIDNFDDLKIASELFR